MNWINDPVFTHAVSTEAKSSLWIADGKYPNVATHVITLMLAESFSSLQ
jgi:hypothetical protein